MNRTVGVLALSVVPFLGLTSTAQAQQVAPVPRVIPPTTPPVVVDAGAPRVTPPVSTVPVTRIRPIAPVPINRNGAAPLKQQGFTPLK